MSKVTSKLQVTIPKHVAEAHGIRPGSEIFFESRGGVLFVRVEPDREETERRLAAFDAATERIEARAGAVTPLADESDRGWTRDDLYEERLQRVLRR